MPYEEIDFMLPRAYEHRVEGKTIIVLIFLNFLSAGYLFKRFIDPLVFKCLSERNNKV